MAESQGFSHITVTADDDDDVVIQAGIAEDAAPEPEPVRQCPEGASHLGEGPCGEAEEDDAEARRPSGAASREKPASKDAYHETTLADLDSVKMSTAQKAVIVVALLGIAAFVAWYLFAR